MKLSTSDQ